MSFHSLLYGATAFSWARLARYQETSIHWTHRNTLNFCGIYSETPATIVFEMAFKWLLTTCTIFSKWYHCNIWEWLCCYCGVVENGIAKTIALAADVFNEKRFRRRLTSLYIHQCQRIKTSCHWFTAYRPIEAIFINDICAQFAIYTAKYFVISFLWKTNTMI